MKKFYVLLSLLAMAVTGISAATSYRSIAVNLSDGTTEQVQIEPDMKALVADGQFAMLSSKGYIGYPIDKVKNWTFSTEPGSDKGWAAIDDVKTDEASVRIVYNGSEISFQGLEAGARVAVYGLDGTLMFESFNGTDGLCVVSLSGLSKGVYVVNYGKHSLKLAVK